MSVSGVTRKLEFALHLPTKPRINRQATMPPKLVTWLVRAETKPQAHTKKPK